MGTILVVLSQEHCCTIRKSGQDILGTKHPKFLTHPVLAVRKAWMVRPPTPSAKKETSQNNKNVYKAWGFPIPHLIYLYFENLFIIYSNNFIYNSKTYPSNYLK